MWYMCTPKANGVGDAVAVPLAMVQWNAWFNVKAIQTRTSWIWKVTGDNSGSADFQPTLDYPKWDDTYVNTIGGTPTFVRRDGH